MPRVLLLLPTSTYRTRDFLDASARLGLDTVVASEEPSTMESFAEDALVTLDFFDPVDAARRIRAFHERFPLTAVIPVDEDTAVVAARVAREIGLPSSAPEAAERARLKHEMRRALEESGVAIPGYRVYRTSDDVGRRAREVRYPAVLKPVFLSGSRGVVRVDDEESFSERFRWLAEFLQSPDLRRRGGEYADLILAEDFVPGAEVAVEGLVTDGAFRPLAIFDKPDPLEGPFFEETIYVTPTRLPSSSEERIVEATGRAAEALGLAHGPVHAELRLPVGGEATVIEIAGRSIGGLCSRTLRFGLGMSLEELVLRHALGEDIAGLGRETEASGVMMIPIPRGGTLLEVTGLAEARAVRGVQEVTVTAHLGQRLVPLPEGASYLGFIFARGAGPAEVERSLREAHSHLRFAIDGTTSPANSRDCGPTRDRSYP